MKKNGFLERFSDEDVDKLYGLKWYQYFEYLLPNLSNEECRKLQSDCLSNQHENREIINSIIKPTNHALEVLDKIDKSGHCQIIISNTQPDDIIWFLNAVGIKKHFSDDRVFGVNAHQTLNSKTDALKAYIADGNFDQIVCIGDSIGDLELGRSVGAINYFYKHPHRKHEPTNLADHVTNDLREILREL